jgi:flagellar protein FliJ
MKKFQFSLSALLKIRIKKEEITHHNFLEALQVLRKIEEELQKLIIEFQKVNNEIRQIQKKIRSREELIDFFEYSNSLKRRIKNQKDIIKEAQFGVEIRRKEVLSAMKERKIIENIKEKKFEEWENEFFEQERKAFDELATIQFESKIRKSFHLFKNKNKLIP